MNTLYDFLGVRSDADDETLRKAFRNAIKATHPDLHAGDPDTLLRFRQIVDANALLRDAKQRATYDWLLQLEHQRFRLKLEYQQRHLKLERQQLRLKRMRIIVSGAIAVTVLTFALVDGYALFVPIPTTAIVAVKRDDGTSMAVAAVKADAVKGDMDNAGEQIETAGARMMEPANPTDQVEPRHKDDSAEVPHGVIRPSTDALATDSSDAQVIAGRELALGSLSNDANFYRERGITAYRNGDFPQAIVNFDEAIRIDPNRPTVFHDRAILWRRRGALDKALIDLDRAIRFSFSDGNMYCDRGLVWYEKGRHDRAVADFNQAIKLDPNSAAACINRGLMSHRNREFNVAFADSRKAIRVDPSIFDVIRRTNSRP